MSPVSAIEGKVRPFFECSGFVHCRYDKSEVVNDGFLVCVQYTSTSSLVVAPHCEKLRICMGTSLDATHHESKD